MEHLKYEVEDRTIAELLGVQNFTNEESAMLELVKNAYDAQAKCVTLDFSNGRLVIEDNGIGMSVEDIRNKWMHVGKSNKGYFSLADANGQQRILAGSKGIGRFALARLGELVTMYTKKRMKVLLSGGLIGMNLFFMSICMIIHFPNMVLKLRSIHFEIVGRNGE